MTIGLIVHTFNRINDSSTVTTDLTLSSPHWHQDQGMYCRGFIFQSREVLLPPAIISKIQQLPESALESWLRTCAGEFALIIVRESSTILITDVIRSIPLFYRITDDAVLISDQVEPLKGPDDELDKTAAASFLYSGYCLQHKTLTAGTHQVEAGGLVYLSENTIEAKSLHRFNSTIPHNQSSDALWACLSDVFDDYVQLLDGRQVALSLSGGYDSRAILSLLLQKGYDHIICFSYGRSNLAEVRTAIEICNRLQIPHIYISYDEIVDAGILEDPTFLSYANFASQDVSMPYMQDYFAVQYLKKNALIEPDAIIAAGHTGDVLSGGHLTKRMDQPDYSAAELIDDIAKTHFNQYHPIPARIKEGIRASLPSLEDRQVPLYLQYQDWERRERQAKFVVNSSRVSRASSSQHLECLHRPVAPYESA